MPGLKSSLKLIALLVGAVLMVSCQRVTGGRSKISIPISDSLSAQTIPVGKKACYGVNVEGPGIALGSAATCGKAVGLTAGFVPEGGVLQLDIPKGSSRKFEVFMFLVDATADCPAFGEGFFATTGNTASTYLAGTTEGVSLVNDVETVTVSVSFPGVANTLASSLNASCAANAALKAQLFSNGDVVDPSGNPLGNFSSPLNESFYTTGLSDPLGIGVITAGGVLNFYTATETLIPPQVTSLTRKPDDGRLFGMLQDGQIVEISISAGVGYYTALTAANCPFSVAGCQVPVWMQSISAGFGTALYSLDHGGNIYSLATGVPVQTGETVPEYVTQVSYY